jgi:hypothetical protein
MKALVGSWDRRPYHLLAEITALRTRVLELQRELDASREENEALRRLVGSLGAEAEAAVGVEEADERAVVLSTR